LHDLRTRRAGLTSFIQLHIEMDGNMNLNEAHEIADAVEIEIRQAFPDSEVLIHQDPQGMENVSQFLRA
jgi:ferrous-iron efflux pump FieF